MNNIRIDIDYIKIYYTSGQTEVKKVKNNTGSMVLDENFNDNSNAWSEVDDDKYYTKVKNGKRYNL